MALSLPDPFSFLVENRRHLKSTLCRQANESKLHSLKLKHTYIYNISGCSASGCSEPICAARSCGVTKESPHILQIYLSGRSAEGSQDIFSVYVLYGNGCIYWLW